MLSNFLKEQNLLPLNTYFKKRDGQRWTFAASSGAKVQLDCIIINKKNGRAVHNMAEHTIHLKE